MGMRLLGVVLALVTLALGQNHQSNARRGPASGYVPDATTAVKIAEAVLTPVYGEKRIASERPFHASLNEDVWTVEGTLYCPDGTLSTTTNMCKGGTAVVKLSKTDARILFMMHYK
jgi:hypothetical protein